MSSARASAISPMKTSVRCMWPARTNLSDCAIAPSTVASFCCSEAIAARASSLSSTAVNRRMDKLVKGFALEPLQHHEPQHVQRRLRRLVLHLLAVADELKRPDARAVGGDDGDRNRPD